MNEGVVTVLKKGSYFGEIGLLRACRRTASIKAISETVDLFVLSKVDFCCISLDGPARLYMCCVASRHDQQAPTQHI